ncbi:MAG: lipopolysaccharide biosynthesis protein [Bacteroidales bacterium]
MAESLKGKTINGMKWSAIERFSSQGIQFVIQIFLARLLLPSDYGVIAMLTIFIAITQSFIDSGFLNALIRKLDRNEDDYTTTFIFNILVGIAFYCLLYFTSPLIASFYKTPILLPITKFIAIGLLLDSFTIVHQAILTIRIDFKTQTYVSFTSTIISGLIAIYLAYKGLGAWALAWQIVINSALKLILFWAIVRWWPRGRFSKKSFASLFGFGSKLLLSGLIDTIYQNIYLIVIGKYFSSKSLGFYSRAKEFSRYPSSSLTSIIQRVTYPVLSEMQEDDEKLKANYRKLLKMSAFIIFPLMVGLSAAADPLIRCLLTDKWADSVILLQILCFSMMWYPIHSINLNLLKVKGRSDLFLKLEIYKKIFITLVLLVSLRFGVIAMCIGQIITSLFSLFVNTYYTGKLIKVGFLQQMKDMLPTLIICTIMYNVIMLMNGFIEADFIKLILDIIVGAVIYIGLSFLNKSPELKELISIVFKKTSF